MKVLMVEPGYVPYEKEINGWKEMQAAVGGLFQAIYPYEEQVAIVCNEEGLINGMEFNRSVPGGYGGVFGPFFVCGLAEDSFSSLTPKQIEVYKKAFGKAEILIGVQRNEPITMKVQAKSKPTPGQDKGPSKPTPGQVR